MVSIRPQPEQALERFYSTMCVHCGHPHISDPLGFCLACTIELRREFYAGLERLTAYLASWAAFEEWEAEHPVVEAR
jgi:hypothetical protein